MQPGNNDCISVAKVEEIIIQKLNEELSRFIQLYRVLE